MKNAKPTFCRKLRERDFYYRKLYDAYMKKGDFDQCKSICRYFFFIVPWGQHQIKTAYRDLLKRNPDDHNNYKMLIKAHQIDPAKNSYTEAEITQIISVLDEQAKVFPKSTVPLTLSMKYAQGETFGKKFDEYIRHAATRAVPSLFATVKPFYTDPAKPAIIEGIVMKHIDSLKTTECFAGSDAPQDPTVLLWLLLFAANHFNQKRDYTKAMELIDQAIDHTPTLVEAYTVKARILKHMNEKEKAADTYDTARKMDLADRYLNARCSKYFIRAGKVEEAEKMMALFVREVNGELNVHEMQCMWYEIELGKEFDRRNQLAKAYKMFKYIEQHFDTIYDDQFDYHYYALKRGNINAYIQMISWEDKLWSHKNFLQGAIGLLKCYAKINELAAKAEKTPEEAKDLQEIAVKDSMEAAVKIATRAVKFHPESVELHQLAVKAFIAKGKWDLAAKSLEALKTKGVDAKALEDVFFDACTIF